MSTAADRLYARLVDAGEGDRAELDDVAAAHIPGNAARQVGALLLTKSGDRVVDPKTVLAWLLAGVGAPAAMVGLLVPIRESGSILPQAALLPLVQRVGRRKLVWVAGAVGQAAAIVVMAVVAATLAGAAAGGALLAALAVFALSRSLSSIAAKDVLGRTIPKGQRGRISGWADSGSGLVAITVGVGIALLGAATVEAGEAIDTTVFVALLAGAAVAWLVAAALYAGIREPDRPADPDAGAEEALSALRLLRTDAPFRRFVVARTLLLVSALTPPYVVAIATEEAGVAVGALGPFVVASGVASLLGGRAWGGLADRSSRLVMVAACGLASAVVVGYIVLLQVEGLAATTWLHPLIYFLLALIHTGSRVGRSTYVVDLARGDRRTDYVAVSNSAMGVLLLVVGGLTAAVGAAGPVPALLVLAAIGAAGVPVGRSLPEV